MDVEAVTEYSITGVALLADTVDTNYQQFDQYIDVFYSTADGTRTEIDLASVSHSRIDSMFVKI